jgi:DivIVA domain-containing protein
VAVFELHDPSLSAAAITGRRFRSARRGYDPAEVDAFLASVADRLDELQREVEQQRGRAELLGRQVAGAQEGAYARVFRQLMDVMRAADDAAAGIKAGAQRDANALRAQAQADADRIVGAARSRSVIRKRVAEEGEALRNPDDPLPPEMWWSKSSAAEPIGED